jgi:hypothetical protein
MKGPSLRFRCIFLERLKLFERKAMPDKRWISSTFGALVVAIALAIAGCGGDGSGDAPTASITKAEFVAKANAACARIKGQTQAEFAEYMKSSAGESLSQAAGQTELGKRFVIAPKQQEVDEFIALGEPSGNEGQVKAIVVAFEGGIKKAEEDPSKAARNSTEAFGAAEKLAAQYGLVGC